MHPATAYRAIIRYLAGDMTEYKAIIGEKINTVEVRYYYNKNNSIQGKLNTQTGELILNDGNVIHCNKGA